MCLLARPGLCHHSTLKCYLAHKQSAQSIQGARAPFVMDLSSVPVHILVPVLQCSEPLASGVVAGQAHRQVVNDDKKHLVCQTKVSLSFRLQLQMTGMTRIGFTSFTC